ncbi:hypothetical protein JKP88DRAFT_295551 [Tribonema minus]|uniref:Poly(A) RNA polymerase mitochondrial-like central palm domain-containing protein n=1 Tax=Tribonema minus TaxID=303371 RepID=A0A836CN95_9STRA|nr:hypothetical protein JKP88DRAFT_295551 [Tribonema minus]
MTAFRHDIAAAVATLRQARPSNCRCSGTHPVLLYAANSPSRTASTLMQSTAANARTPRTTRNHSARRSCSPCVRRRLHNRSRDYRTPVHKERLLSAFVTLRHAFARLDVPGMHLAVDPMQTADGLVCCTDAISAAQDEDRSPELLSEAGALLQLLQRLPGEAVPQKKKAACLTAYEELVASAAGVTVSVSEGAAEAELSEATRFELVQICNQLYAELVPEPHHLIMVQRAHQRLQTERCQRSFIIRLNFCRTTPTCDSASASMATCAGRKVRKWARRRSMELNAMAVCRVANAGSARAALARLQSLHVRLVGGAAGDRKHAHNFNFNPPTPSPAAAAGDVDMNLDLPGMGRSVAEAEELVRGSEAQRCELEDAHPDVLHEMMCTEALGARVRAAQQRLREAATRVELRTAERDTGGFRERSWLHFKYLARRFRRPAVCGFVSAQARQVDVDARLRRRTRSDLRNVDGDGFGLARAVPPAESAARCARELPQAVQALRAMETTGESADKSAYNMMTAAVGTARHKLGSTQQKPCALRRRASQLAQAQQLLDTAVEEEEAWRSRIAAQETPERVDAKYVRVVARKTCGSPLDAQTRGSQGTHEVRDTRRPLLKYATSNLKYVHVAAREASERGEAKTRLQQALRSSEDAIEEMRRRKANVYVMSRYLETSGYTGVKPVARARVPVIKVVDPNCGGIAIDLVINNHHAVHNTRLMKAYAQFDERCRQLIFIIKHWAKCRRLNEASMGTLSSYSLSMMVVHYLQGVGILPNLQGPEAHQVALRAPPTRAPPAAQAHHNGGANRNGHAVNLGDGTLSPYICGSLDVTFLDDMEAARRLPRHARLPLPPFCSGGGGGGGSGGGSGGDGADIASLLVGFFRYFALQDEGFDHKRHVVTVHLDPQDLPRLKVGGGAVAARGAAAVCAAAD